MKTNKPLTTKELLSHTFDMMYLMKQKAIGIEEGKAQANLIKQANNIFRYELDKAIAIQKFDGIKIESMD